MDDHAFLEAFVAGKRIELNTGKEATVRSSRIERTGEQTAFIDIDGEPTPDGSPIDPSSVRRFLD